MFVGIEPVGNDFVRGRATRVKTLPRERSLFVLVVEEETGVGARIAVTGRSTTAVATVASATFNCTI